MRAVIYNRLLCLSCRQHFIRVYRSSGLDKFKYVKLDLKEIIMLQERCKKDFKL